jgi:hypothetical protein
MFIYLRYHVSLTSKSTPKSEGKKTVSMRFILGHMFAMAMANFLGKRDKHISTETPIRCLPKFSSTRYMQINDKTLADGGMLLS